MVTLESGHQIDVDVVPSNATITWTTTDSNVAYGSTTGFFHAANPGTATITATISGTVNGVQTAKSRSWTVHVGDEFVTMENPWLSIDVGSIGKIKAISNSPNAKFDWSSSNTSVAIVSATGEVTGIRPGIATITAVSKSTGKECSYEVWVREKKAVFLIHGRTSNSMDIWGAINHIDANPKKIDSKDNNAYNYLPFATTFDNYVYVNKESQDIINNLTVENYSVKIAEEDTAVIKDSYYISGIHNGEFRDGGYIETHSEDGNLAYYLKQQGYIENINLFVFNYPNEDAVIHDAIKFRDYIANLIQYVRDYGNDEMKACFYDSRGDYKLNNYTFNIVGHSMGGLVARYYIENMNQDGHVEKLITIDTPHWGSRLADVSGVGSFFDMHKLCDHDLMTDSSMYGGKNNDSITCLLCSTYNYSVENYLVTDELLYNSPRLTKYYAIASLNHTMEHDNEGLWFEMSLVNYTYDSLSDFLYSKGVRSGDEGVEFNFLIGDNVVEFTSQIGWTKQENNNEGPLKIVQMQEIYVYVDTDGGNSTSNHLHGKVVHREPVMQQVCNYLRW